ncbi:MAG: hypothetical protein DRP26_01240 [Candidatus Zixiibacteriota bacterium]|nr:MAG: hypothetical protein DRP26_01240 [candidate division Zixibacteria bacterium]
MSANMDNSVNFDKTEGLNIATELMKFNLGAKEKEVDKVVDFGERVGYEDLAALYEVSCVVNSTLILDDMLDIVMKKSIKLLKAERGFLMLLDDNGKLKFKTAHNIKKEQMDSEDMRISTTIADMVVKTGKSIYTSDAQTDDRFSRKASIIDLNIRSAMCVPLMIKKRIIGVLYLDNSSQANVFIKQDLALFEMFAAQAALAIHNARLYTKVLELQKYQQNIIANTPIGLLVVDAKGIIRSFNEVAEKIFNKIGWTYYPPEEGGMIGLSINDVIPDKYRITFVDSIFPIRNEPLQISRFHVDYQGEEIILKLRFCPFEDYKGESIGNIILIEDITEQVVLEQYLILSEKLIAKGEMAAAIGHELNNYLTVISTNAQLLALNLSQGNHNKIQNKIDIIVKNVDRIKRFSDGLMDFSTLDSKPVPYDLKLLIEDLILFIRPQNKFKRVKFNVDIPADLPKVYIDVGQLHQVFLNLFINSVDIFAEYRAGEGEITVKAEALPEKAYVKIVITDNGPGIPEDILPKIFEPHITSKRAGHGLGLSTCLKIINNHNGKIIAENLDEGGAAFTIEIPMATGLR